MLLMLGCNSQEESAPAPQKADVKVEQAQTQPVVEVEKNVEQVADKAVADGVGMLEGTVRYFDLEGGFWGIETDNGLQILPHQLADEYKKDGLRLRFNAAEITDMMTIAQWGTLSNISDVEVIGQVEAKSSNPNI